MKEILAILATGLAIAGNLPYLANVVRKKTKPHPYSWLVWSIVSGTVFLGQTAKGAGVGAWPTLASEIFTVIIFLFSLRYGFQKIEKRDKYFLAAALAGLVPWFITHDPTWSVVIVVSIDIVGFIPTIRKTWNNPKTESYELYLSNVLRHGLALFSLEAYNVATALHSVAMIIANTIMVGIIWRKK